MDGLWYFMVLYVLGKKFNMKTEVSVVSKDFISLEPFQGER
jgi:hypothetical protein